MANLHPSPSATPPKRWCSGAGGRGDGSEEDDVSGTAIVDNDGDEEVACADSHIGGLTRETRKDDASTSFRRPSCQPSGEGSY